MTFFNKKRLIKMFAIDVNIKTIETVYGSAPFLNNKKTIGTPRNEITPPQIINIFTLPEAMITDGKPAEKLSIRELIIINWQNKIVYRGTLPNQSPNRNLVSKSRGNAGTNIKKHEYLEMYATKIFVRLESLPLTLFVI